MGLRTLVLVGWDPLLTIVRRIGLLVNIRLRIVFRHLTILTLPLFAWMVFRHRGLKIVRFRLGARVVSLEIGW